MQLIKHNANEHDEGQFKAMKRPNSFNCEICDLDEKSAMNLAVHLLEKHEKKVLAEAELRNKRKRKSDDVTLVNFSCSKCDFKSGNQSDFKKHVDTKHEEDSFKCEICKKSFSSSAFWTWHVLAMHQKSYACLKCSFKASNVQAYRGHHHLYKVKFRDVRCIDHHRTSRCSCTIDITIELNGENFDNRW